MKSEQANRIATRRGFLYYGLAAGALAGMAGAPGSASGELLTSVPEVAPGDVIPSDRTLSQAVEQAHTVLWSKFITRDGIILDFQGDLPTPEDCRLGKPNALGWWTPIENGPMLTGLYLPAVCERARRTHSPQDRAHARLLSQGLMKCASASDVPGFIARGFGKDGRCHYPLGSDDQTHPWFYGLRAYLRSGIPMAPEKDRIVSKMHFVGEALERTGWRCPCDGSFVGQYRGSFSGAGFRDAARYLYMVRLMFELTQDEVWLRRYHERCFERPEGSTKTRLEICEAGADFDPKAASLWIYVGSQAALAALAEWEQNDSVRQRFRAGLESGKERVAPFCKECVAFDNNDRRRFGNADWRAGYPTWYVQKTPEDAVRLSQTGDTKKLGERKKYEIKWMRNPLAAAAIIALSGGGSINEEVANAIKHYDYARLYVSQFLFAECAYYA